MININQLISICDKHGTQYSANVPLAPFTTFKIGGPCDLLVKVNNNELIRDIVLSGVPFRVLGNGSNVLIPDEGIKGAVLLFGSDFAEIEVCGGFLTCQAGTSLTNLCNAARNASLAGLEFAYGIPGTVGGATYMNAGAYDGEMSQVLYEISYIDKHAKLKTMSCENAGFSYRRSPFTGTQRIIISANFYLDLGDSKNITAKMEDFMNRRKDKQPLDFPSAGSTFKRPDNDYASRLIDVCGLKGFSVGGAQVSEKHAGFVVNKGGATCRDVLELIDAVTERVFKETGVTLEREVELL